MNIFRRNLKELFTASYDTSMSVYTGTSTVNATKSIIPELRNATRIEHDVLLQAVVANGAVALSSSHREPHS
jgi:hypothetical protein